MIWAKAIGWIILAGTMSEIVFGGTGWPARIFAAFFALIAIGLLASAYAYHLGRESAFADMRKFGRAFARAKEP